MLDGAGAGFSGGLKSAVQRVVRSFDFMGFGGELQTRRTPKSLGRVALIRRGLGWYTICTILA